jgi:hypothetical protein
MLGGCIYVPWLERPANAKDTDFRPILENRSENQIRVGKSDRASVAALLGEPPLISEDGGSFGYTFTAVSGIRIFLPLFFAPMPADAHVYLLRLNFGRDDVLLDYTIQRADQRINDSFICRTAADAHGAIEQLNNSRPKLLYVSDVALRLGATTQP